MENALTGKVALVTGASRGAGKGIAEELGAQGATVYVTGRSTADGMGPVVFGRRLPGTIQATADEVTRLGGTGIPVAVDHRDDAAVEQLFARIRDEQGRLDILVNNAYIVPAEMLNGSPFWEMPLSMWDEMTDVGVRSSYVASVHGGRLMVEQSSGLIAFTSSSGGGSYRYTPAYGIGKAAIDRMAFDMGHELKPHGVATASLWLGLIRTERVDVVAEQMPQFDLTKTESPRFLGRGVSALYRDPEIVEKTGRIWYTAELGTIYGFTDIDGRQPASRRAEFGAPPAYRV
jgi:NAD(P)-dependent dehydrogenase (short-subunit alcohol dehydrogenase family)